MILAPVPSKSSPAGFGQREEGLFLLDVMLLAEGLVIAAGFIGEGCLQIGVDELAYDADGARRVQDMHNWLLVARSDSNRSVNSADGSPTNEQRHIESFPGHF